MLSSAMRFPERTARAVADTGFETSMLTSTAFRATLDRDRAASGSGSIPWPIAFSSKGCSSRLGTMACAGRSATFQRTCSRPPVAAARCAGRSARPRVPRAA